MLILLPPSEGKTAPRRGRPLDLERLSFPELNPARDQLVDALAAVSATPDAQRVLKVGESLAAEVAANLALRSAPSAPAAALYTGVLFDALGFDTLGATGKRRAASSVLIFSALFGVVRPGDRLPAYRLAGNVTLPQIGGLARFWKPRLADVLPTQGPIIDCRSSMYAGMWTPPGALAVRVFREVGQRRTVVSHHAKHARGLVARALLQAPDAPRTGSQAAAAASAWFATHTVTTAGGATINTRVELTENSLDIITD